MSLQIILKINELRKMGRMQKIIRFLVLQWLNYKNILQVKIQKEFKVTPDYLEMSYDTEAGYEMGVYLCVGKPIHTYNFKDATPFSYYGSFESIQSTTADDASVLIFLGNGTHRIKKKAEQLACEMAISTISK